MADAPKQQFSERQERMVAAYALADQSKSRATDSKTGFKIGDFAVAAEQPDQMS